MSPDKDRSYKLIAMSLIWLIWLSSFVIRFALGVVAPTLMQLYNIPPKTMGYVLSGWNWTYTASLWVVGPAVDFFGAWIVLGGASVIWGLATFALPIATTATGLFVMRAMFGLGNSTVVPATSASISQFFSLKERARAIAVAFSGNQVGLAIGAPIAALILTRWGWEAVFYCIGGASLLLTLFWFLFYPDKRIGRRVAPQTVAPKENATQHVSWTSLLRYRSTWGICLGQMGNLYAFYFFVTWLPGYLVIERNMTVMKTAIVASLPFWTGMLGLLGGGWMGDFLIQRGVSLTVCRKSLIGIGMTAATIMVVSAAFTERTWLAVTFLILCVGFLRTAGASLNSLPLDLAPPSLVGSLSGIQNFFGNVGGLLAPIVTGYIVSATGSFLGALVVAGGMALFGAFSYVFVMGNVETLQIGSHATAAVIQPART